MSAPQRLGVLISFSGDGGVERMVLNLLAEFVRLGYAVDLLAIRLQGGHAERVPPGVNLIRLKARHALTSIPEVMRYLRDTPPAALLVAKDRAGRAALLARRLSGAKVPIWIRLGTNLSAALEGKSRLLRWLRTAPMRWLYRWVDGVVAVSAGVAEDTVRITGLPRERMQVIRNPVITPVLEKMAAEPVTHPWLAQKTLPVIVGIGRLTRQKGFETLLRAFATIQNDRPSRLIILGEGGQREELQALAQELGVTGKVALPGFASNPYAYLARADLFVLSSAWEGSPNALTEALALGVPSVSTNCPSGPDEILADGRYGPLVPVGDDQKLAAAMAATLAAPLPAAELKSAVTEYNAAISARRYLEVMGLART